MQKAHIILLKRNTIWNKKTSLTYATVTGFGVLTDIKKVPTGRFVKEGTKSFPADQRTSHMGRRDETRNTNRCKLRCLLPLGMIISSD